MYGKGRPLHDLVASLALSAPRMVGFDVARKDKRLFRLEGAQVAHEAVVVHR
jgi:hypothetical protein